MAKFSKKLVEAIVEMVECDMSVTDICKAVGITRKTFYEWMRTKPEFARAVADARERAYEELIILARQALRERIVGYTVEETTYTYEPSSYDEEDMVLKKKVVKQKRKEPSITSLNNMIQRLDSKKDKTSPSVSNSPFKKKEKQGMISPRNSKEALILADFYKKMEEDSIASAKAAAS